MSERLHTSVDRTAGLQARPERLGVLCNPESGWVRRNVELTRSTLHAMEPRGYREASAPDDLMGATRELVADECGALCVVGGDGTLHAALTALVRHVPRTDWPLLAVIPAGSTNMSAKDLGAHPSPRRSLLDLAAWKRGDREGSLSKRPVIRVEAPDGVVRSGLFFGAGAVAEGVSFLRENLYHKGIHGGATSFLSVAWVVAKLALGGSSARSLVTRMTCDVDGRTVETDAAALALVTTLDRLILGARPHWGEGSEPLRFTLVSRRARRLWLRLPRVARGRPGEALTAEGGYHSHRAREVSLRFSGPYVIDGEVYEADEDLGPVSVSAIPDVRWLRVSA